MIDIMLTACVAIGGLAALVLLYGFGTGRISNVVYDRVDFIKKIECCSCIEKYRDLMIIGDVAGAEEIIDLIQRKIEA